MLKDFGYFGVYRNNNITVNVMLENPLEHNQSADMLTFGVALASKDRSREAPLYDDFSFYVMDEANHIYNLQSAPYLANIVYEDGDPIRNFKLLYTTFKTEFVFQDLRLVFFDRIRNRMEIIRLEH